MPARVKPSDGLSEHLRVTEENCSANWSCQWARRPRLVALDPAQPRSNALSVAQDLVAGTIGGCSGIVIGQPFDTVKVRLQSAGAGVYRGPLQCAAEMVKHEGATALFKGMATPLLANAPINAIVFAAYGGGMRLLDGAYPPQRAEGGDEPSYWRHFVAGTAAGAVQCVVTTPSDHIKCQLQVQVGQAGRAGNLYSGPRDVVAAMWRARGLASAYRGFATCLIRDSPTYGLYFASYELGKDVLSELPGGRGSGSRAGDAALWVMLTSGAFAGVITWGIAYPFDTAKTIIQTAKLDADPRSLRMARVFADRYRAGGWRAFTVGLGTALVRAAPVNGVTLLLYDVSLKLMRGD